MMRLINQLGSLACTLKALVHKKSCSLLQVERALLRELPNQSHLGAESGQGHSDGAELWGSGLVLRSCAQGIAAAPGPCSKKAVPVPSLHCASHSGAATIFGSEEWSGGSAWARFRSLSRARSGIPCSGSRAEIPQTVIRLTYTSQTQQFHTR